jgi:hypothetical protein
MSAPNRGRRKCATCVHYTDKRDEWERTCKLDYCECKAKGKEFGIASCPNWTPKRFIDTSDHGDIGGYPTGYCEWKCPPILRKITWDQWKYRLVNADGSWCHCWEERAVHDLDIGTTEAIEARHVAITDRKVRTQ